MCVCVYIHNSTSQNVILSKVQRSLAKNIVGNRNMSHRERLLVFWVFF